MRKLVLFLLFLCATFAPVVAADNSVAATEKRIANSQLENACSWDKANIFIGCQQGDANSSVPPGEPYQLYNGTVSHNHTKMAAPSYEDWAMMFYRHLVTLRVAYYSARRGFVRSGDTMLFLTEKMFYTALGKTLQRHGGYLRGLTVYTHSYSDLSLALDDAWAELCPKVGCNYVKQ